MSTRSLRVGPSGGGPGYTPGHWRADKAGSSAAPSGPEPDRQVPEWKPGCDDFYRRASEATARNVAAREESLASKRWRPS